MKTHHVSFALLAILSWLLLSAIVSDDAPTIGPLALAVLLALVLDFHIHNRKGR